MCRGGVVVLGELDEVVEVDAAVEGGVAEEGFPGEQVGSGGDVVTDAGGAAGGGVVDAVAACGIDLGEEGGLGAGEVGGGDFQGVVIQIDGLIAVVGPLDVEGFEGLIGAELEGAVGDGDGGGGFDAAGEEERAAADGGGTCVGVDAAEGPGSLPDLRREVMRVAVLSRMTPAMVLFCVLAPVSVRVFEPAPTCGEVGGEGETARAGGLDHTTAGGAIETQGAIGGDVGADRRNGGCRWWPGCPGRWSARRRRCRANWVCPGRRGRRLAGGRSGC